MLILPVLSMAVDMKNQPVLRKSKSPVLDITQESCVKSSPNYLSIIANKGVVINNFALGKNYAKISFCGYPVHIVDGSNHATNVAHFAKAIEKNMDIEMHEVLVTPKDKNVKNLKSLEFELKKLNSSPDLHKGDYVAVPALASVALLNLKDRIKSVLGKDVNLTAETVKVNKPLILEFLKTIYENPSKYRQDLNYMDPQEQGLEYTYGVLQELNNLKRKGLKVYVPAGHPHDDSIKWLAGERGLKPELYNYIATGVDVDGAIKRLAKEIKDNNWYTFNLLALSDAEIVTVKETDGIKDYMFAAYDTCITKGARGVYNFSPVRENNKIIGYSYTDTVTNQYPYDEFPANEEIANISKFVGKNINDVLATNLETKQFIKTGVDLGKLYKVQDIFSAKEIEENKINLKGDFVDGSLELFFRKNNNDKIIFPKCDCESSGKPSVLPMWGSCFAVFNVIAKDIQKQELQKKFLNDIKIKTIYERALDDENKGYLAGAEYHYNKILDLLDIDVYCEEEFSPSIFELDYLFKNKQKFFFLNKLLDVLEKQNKYENAKDVLNYMIDVKIQELSCIDKGFFSKMKSVPQRLKIAQDYSKIGNYCARLKENYPAKVCSWASIEISLNTAVGQEILNRRLQGNRYIGDLYDKYQ